MIALAALSACGDNTDADACIGARHIREALYGKVTFDTNGVPASFANEDIVVMASVDVIGTVRSDALGVWTFDTGPGEYAVCAGDGDCVLVELADGAQVRADLHEGLQRHWELAPQTYCAN